MQKRRGGRGRPQPAQNGPVLCVRSKQYDLLFRDARVPLPRSPFKLLALLAEKPGELVTKEEIYSRLWPGSPPDDHPYEQQIKDHKRRILCQIRKCIRARGRPPREIRRLIRSRYGLGYYLNLKPAQVSFLR